MSRGSKLFGAVLVAVVAVAGADAARAQSGDLRELLNRLNRLETDVQTLQRQQATGRPATGGGAAAPAVGSGAFEVRMGEMEELVRTLTGRVERNEFGVRQLNERIERMASDLEFRLGQLEQRASAAPAPAPASAAPGPAAQAAPAPQPAQRPAPAQAAVAAPATPPASLTQGSPEEQYAAAYRLIEQRQLGQAEQAFQQFLRTNGRHRLADNARYWLAETHYARRQFDQAAVAFAEAYQAAPKGDKAADNLLKLGLSLSQLRRRDDACNTFAALSKEFPNLPSAQRQRVQQERSQLGCPA